MGDEIHVLRDLGPHRHELATLGLRGRSILEVGAGTGALTELLLEQGPARVVAYEIVPGLCRLRDPRLELHEEDITGADLDSLAGQGFALIANPPYSLLPYLRGVIERLGVADVLVMASPKKAALFEGYEVAFELPGEAFEPPARGRHLVLRRGFAPVR